MRAIKKAEVQVPRWRRDVRVLDEYPIRGSGCRFGRGFG